MKEFDYYVDSFILFFFTFEILFNYTLFICILNKKGGENNV